MKQEISRFVRGDMLLIFEKDEKGMVGFTLIPKETEGMLKEKDCGAAPLVELYVRGDVLPADYAAGNTMCGSASTFSLVFERQYTDGDSIVTCFRDSTGSREVTHTLVFSEELRAVECYSEIKNAGDRGFTLEMISSGNIGGLTPYDAEIGRASCRERV